MRRSIVFGLLCVVVSAHAAPEGETSLSRFFGQVQTYTAKFEQEVLDEGMNIIEESQGTMWISRPGKFRWDYQPPLEQKIISNGTKVWVHDVELEQVTIRPLGDTIGRTPANILAGKGELSKGYNIKDMGAKGGYFWVRLKPKDKEASFENIFIGFKEKRLRIMELIDGLGQTTRIQFKNEQENLTIADKHFNFVPPANVDIIDETL
ncbi:outer membrane lipoprotein chaperone LolA [Pseudomonadota bacterium]